MRARMWTLLLAAALGAGTFLAAAPPVPAQDLKLPAYRTVTLDNGLTLQLLPHAAVPMVTFELWIRAGASLDPAGKEGLAALTAEALRKGAGDRDAEAFAEAADFLGADFATSVNRDRVRVHLDLQAKDFDEGLALLADAVLRPAFAGDEIRKLAGQMAESVVQAKDNPRNVLGDYHDAFFFGDHPYGNAVDGTETSLPGLGPDDARRFHADWYGADRAILTVAGDIDPAVVERKVREAFGAMPAAGQPLPPLPDAPRPDRARVLLVNKTDTPQTWFRIGGLGPAMDDPDYAAAELVRTVFGGRFTSWLNTALRIESGLTYGARYYFERGFVAGPAVIFSYTAKETTREAIDLALAQLDRLHDEGIEGETLASAKAYMKGQAPYDYETAVDLASRISELAFYGVDRSRVDGLFAAIDEVTPEDCARVIGEYFARESLVFTCVGVRAEVEDVLAGYGEIHHRENSEPGFR